MSKHSRAGEIAAWTSDKLSADEKQAFWQRVLDYEHAPLATDFQRLVDAGIELPPPDAMDDRHLTAKLWEIIEALASLSVFLESTDP